MSSQALVDGTQAMFLAATFTVTRETVGMVAVMVIAAVACGIATWAITGIVAFMGIDNGNAFSQMIATIRNLLIIAAICVGAYLGYQLMH